MNAVAVLNVGLERSLDAEDPELEHAARVIFSGKARNARCGAPNPKAMKIRDVRTHLLTARWSDDLYMPVALHSTALIELLTDGGISGVGETILGYFAPEAVAPLVNFYKPLLIGADPDSSCLWQRLYVSSIWWGRSGAACSVLSGIDLALWDIKAKVAGVPLYKLLGGLAKSRVALYCSGGPALWPNSENVAKCRYYVDRGYRAVKFATGFYVKEGSSQAPKSRAKPIPGAILAEQEAEKCQLVRNGVGAEVEIILDGHQSGIADPYSLSDALRVAEAVAPSGLLFFEEPLPYTDRWGYAELRKQGKVAIAGGESLSGMHEFQQYFEIGALDIAQPDLTFVGGLTPCQDITAEAVSRNLRIAIHCGGTAGPGFAASVHLSFATAASIVLEHLLHNTSIQNDLLLEPVCLNEGTIAPPTAPGSGVVHLTESLLAKYPYIPGTGEVT